MKDFFCVELFVSSAMSLALNMKIITQYYDIILLSIQENNNLLNICLSLMFINNDH